MIIFVFVLIASFSGCSDDPYVKGKNAYLFRNFDEAEKYLTEAVARNPRHAKALFYLGQTYYDQKKYDLAIRNLQSALNINSKLVDANYFIGQSYIHLDQPRNALSYYQTYLKKKPQGKYAAAARDHIDNFK